MLIFTLEARLKKYLRLSIAEVMEKGNIKEENKVIGFIIKRLVYFMNVVLFQKQTSETLIQVIPLLIKEIQTLAGMNKLTETNVKANDIQMLKFYWNIQKLFISKGQRSFTVIPLSYFECRKTDFGPNNL
jgi:hypothetical protein